MPFTKPRMEVIDLSGTRLLDRLPRLLHERHVHALPLGQAVRDDDAAVGEVVIGPLLMPTLAEAPVGLKVLLNCFEGERLHGIGRDTTGGGVYAIDRWLGDKSSWKATFECEGVPL
jgi:hypothetical protein